MIKPSCAPIFGLVGLTVFGVAYDSGVFGRPDGHDHSALVSMPLSTSVASVNTLVVANNVTGEDVVFFPRPQVAPWHIKG